MSLLSKVVGVVDKAVGDRVVEDKVDLLPAHNDLFLKKRSMR